MAAKKKPKERVRNWTSVQVESFIFNLTNDDSVARKFRDELIDGEALVLLTLNDLVHQMHMKLGTALKIHRFVQFLELYGTWNT